MKAFLLAAGKGTRLKPYTDEMPKCLVPINGKPLLQIWIELFEKNNIKDVLVNTHHFADKVEAFLKEIQKKVRVKIHTFYERKLLGSGGTVMANKDFLENDEEFIVAYADNLTNIDLEKMADFHKTYCKKHKGVLTMGLFRAPVPGACGIAEIDSLNRIVSFIEKPETPASNLANGGIYIGNRELFNCISLNDDKNADLIDFGHHILPQLAGKMVGYEIKEYLRDIGTIESYKKAQKEWKQIN